MNGKRNWSKILLVLGVVIGVLGVSYALWLVTFSSTNNNTITATCFNVSFTDQNNISIEKAYPLLDKDGKKLTPYEFTITNNCDTYVKYNINLEILNNSTLTNMDYIKLMLDDETPSLVSSYDVTTKTLSNASTAYKIKTSYLDAKESKTYNLRLWLDENVTGETEGVQNNTFASKITVNASYTDKYLKNAVEYITTLASTDTTNLAIDDYDNIRYIGKDPNNYISINGDMWRIIGVMKDIDNGKGRKEDKVKIIRAKSVEDYKNNVWYSWDTSLSSVNGGFGVNEWSQAKLMKLLNPGYEDVFAGGSLYWNSGVGRCCVGKGNVVSQCDFTDIGIKDKLKMLIGDAVWNIGADKTNDYNVATKQFYDYERSNNNGKTCTSSDSCNDTVERTTIWTGKIGLMYPSDYGYATSGSDAIDRATCLNINLNNWDTGSGNECSNNDWLFNSKDQWTMIPSASSSYSYEIFYITENGGVDRIYASKSYEIGARPVAYLLSSVGIQSGDGSYDNPFMLEI